MSSEVFEFQWSVPDPGYQWLDGFVPADGGPNAPNPSEGMPALVLIDRGYFIRYPRRLIRRSELPGARVYDPLRDHHALFREFAATPPTPEGVLAFAGQYGALGISCGATVEDPA